MKKIVKFEFSIYDSNETRAPIANPPNRAQLEDTPTIPPSYIRVRAKMWEQTTGRPGHSRGPRCIPGW